VQGLAPVEVGVSHVGAESCTVGSGKPRKKLRLRRALEV